MFEVKDKIEKPNAKGRWVDVWNALDKSPVGGGIQESWDAMGIKLNRELGSLRNSITSRYGRGVFDISGAGGMITIIRLKETK